jgi:ferric-dicitrate binding protein FerR (iron transport regulator)
MNSQDDNENELQRKERELQERENALRLRELEAEINQPPLYETAKHQEPEGSVKRRFGQLVNVAKFLAIVVAVVVTIKVGLTLAYVLMIGAIAWVAYKIFLESDRSKRSTQDERPRRRR